MNKVNVIAFRVSFLMEHQSIVPDLQAVISELKPDNDSSINRESPEYLMGAYEALTALVASLERKGI